jgi:hypothetical protein
MSKEYGKGKCKWDVSLGEHPEGHFTVDVGYGCGLIAQIEINEFLQLLKLCQAMKGIRDYSFFGGDFTSGGKYNHKRMLETIYEPKQNGDCCAYWIDPITGKDHRKRPEDRKWPKNLADELD